MEDVLEQIKNSLLELNFEKLKDVVQNLNSCNECLDYLNYWENGEDFFRTFYDNDIDGAVRAVCYGDYTYTDEYAIINTYGNIDSISAWDYENLLEESIDDITDNLIELWEDDVDDWVKKDLPLELVNLINQYVGSSAESEVV